MDLNKNYYALLGVSKESTEKEIKKTYYKLSFTHHPDKGGDAIIFDQITEAYNVLSEFREEYDLKSKYGANYDESYELLNYEFDSYKKGWDENKFEDWKKDNQLNVIIYIDSDFKGAVEYERYVSCKDCSGSGKDINSKIQIRDEDGNVLKIFEGSDGCDFCEGSGKNWMGTDCNFCGGKGKVGSNDCQTCNGERRILGKQKLKGIRLKKKEKSHKVDFMGHVSKEDKDIYGHLWVVKKD
jgi:DnaJ-class molecular chaperone